MIQLLDYRCDALVSECGRYRYWLSREWDNDLPVACWIMLNPSTADATKDDPTIRRCVSFARSWSCGGIVVVNLFALRATDPKELRKATDPVGPHNDEHLKHSAGSTGPVVAAWGAHGAFKCRDRQVVRLLEGKALQCLGYTMKGHPRHPLYLADATALERFPPK